MRQEQFISYWDGFWRKFVEFNQMMYRSVKEAIDNLWFSLNYSKYSFLPELFYIFQHNCWKIRIDDLFSQCLIVLYFPANLILYIFTLIPYG